jgi:CheY-like chemotaxis protein
MASVPPDDAERELLGRLAARVAGKFEHLFTRLGEHFERIDAIAGDRAEVQDELADGRELLARGDALLRQLIAFGGDRNLAPEPVELRTRAGSWWPRLQRVIGPDHVLELHLRGGPLACIDDEQLVLALTNLCLNARDASPPGEAIELHIEPSAAGPSGPGRPAPGAARAWVKLEIVDRGSGMDAQTLAHALEPFFTTKARHVGLGLSAARAIVEAHGGALELDSSPGAGTRVRVHLPTAGPEPALDDPPPGGVVRVLLVDSEHLIVRWMRRSLTSKGCMVRVASSVLEAREHLRDDWPDLAIVDRNLPEGDGRTFARELATDRPERPVLFATTRSQLLRDRDRGLPSLPAQIEILDKPFSTRAFDALVGEVLARIRAP